MIGIGGARGQKKHRGARCVGWGPGRYFERVCFR